MLCNIYIYVMQYIYNVLYIVSTRTDPDEICVHTCFSFVECGQRSSATYIFMTPMKAVFAIGFAQ